MCFYIDDKLLLIKSILKMHFQSAYNQYQPLFSNKAILKKIVINIKKTFRSIRAIRGQKKQFPLTLNYLNNQ